MVKPSSQKTRIFPLTSPDKILDAAESLFCHFGFYGTSIRDIAKKACVPLGVMTYHFKSKEDLFHSVVTRRADEHLGRLSAALDIVVEEAGDKPPRAEAVIRVFLEPIVERSLHGGEGWRSTSNPCPSRWMLIKLKRSCGP